MSKNTRTRILLTAVAALLPSTGDPVDTVIVETSKSCLQEKRNILKETERSGNFFFFFKNTNNKGQSKWVREAESTFSEL